MGRKRYQSGLLKGSLKARRKLTSVMQREQQRLRSHGVEPHSISSLAAKINLPGEDSDIDFSVPSDDIEADSKRLHDAGIPFHKNRGTYKQHWYVTPEGVDVDVNIRPRHEVEYQLPGIKQIAQLPRKEKERIIRRKLQLKQEDKDAYRKYKFGLYEQYGVLPPGGDWSKLKVPEKKGSASKVAGKEFAPGIPAEKTTHPIPTVKEPRPWRLVVQHHPAIRAGDHHDIRLVDMESGHAHSWATKKDLPEPGKTIRIYQQPTHTAHYALNFQGPIRGRYGKTKPGQWVKQVKDDHAEVLQADDKLIRFNTYGKENEEFVLARAKKSRGAPAWSLINVTKTKERVPKELPFHKPKYKETPTGTVNFDDDNQVMMAKLDGGHNTFLLHKGRRPRAFSYREPKKGTRGVIEHSQKLEDLYKSRVPKELHKTILRGELYARTHDGKKPVPAETVAGMMNAGVLKSREKQKEHGKLRAAVFDVVQFKGKDMSQAGYDEKLEALKEVRLRMPQFEIPDMALTREEKEALLTSIKEKKHPATHEGVVLHHRHEAKHPIKAKFKDEHDIHVRKVFEAKDKHGKPKGEAGGFDFSWEPDGPVVGRIGTGFNRKLKLDMWKRKELYEGSAVARVTALGKYQSGALAKPSFQGWHPDKSDKAFWEAEPMQKESMLKIGIGPITAAALEYAGKPELAEKARQFGQWRIDKMKKMFLHEPKIQPRMLQGRHILPERFVHGAANLLSRHPEAALAYGVSPIPGSAMGYIAAKEKLTQVIENKAVQRAAAGAVHHAHPKLGSIKPFISKERKKAHGRVDSHFGSDADDKWDSFLGHAKRKSFVRAMQSDPRTDPKLHRHVDQMNRLQLGKMVGQVGKYNIIRKRGGGLGCTCPDWRYRRSVAGDKEQDCKHITEHRMTEKKAASGLRKRITVKSIGGLEHKMFLAGKHVGTMTMDPSDPSKVSVVSIDPKYKGMGLGKKFYGEVARNLPGGRIKSDYLTTPDAQRVWRGMNRRGYKVKENVLAGNIRGLLMDQFEGPKAVKYQKGLGQRSNFVSQLPEAAVRSGTKKIPAASTLGYLEPGRKAEIAKALLKGGKIGTETAAAVGLEAAARKVGKRKKGFAGLSPKDLKVGLRSAAGAASPILGGGVLAGALSAKKGRRHSTAVGSLVGGLSGHALAEFVGSKTHPLVGDIAGKPLGVVGSGLGAAISHKSERVNEKTASAELKPTTKLKPHQERVLKKLQRSGGVIVAHRLGGGKTLTSIAAAVKEKEPLEVIAPAPLVANYEKEIAKHTTGELPRRIKSFSKTVRDASSQKATLNPDSLLVIDEAHRLRNTGTKQHKFIAVPARDARKKLLLTGTPVYNQPSDIAPLANIAAGEKRLPENKYDFKRQFLKEVVVKPGFFRGLTGVKPGARTVLQNKKVLRKALAGHIDVYEGDDEGYPTRVDEKVHVPMSEKQHKIYNYHIGQVPYHIRAKIRSGLPPSKQESKNLNAYLAGVRQTSLSPRPYVHDMGDKDEVEHVPKLKKAVEALHDSQQQDKNFKGVVYSNYVQAGLKPYSRMLKKKGIKHHMFTGKVSKKERAKMVQDYNEGKVPVLLVSSSGTEGLDLKGTKLMQVMEPHFNNSKIHQVIGRGIRYKSHAHLPKEERVVRVQKYYSSLPQGRLGRMASLLGAKSPLSTEQWLQDRADEKDEVTKQLKQVMREAHDLPPEPRQEP